MLSKRSANSNLFYFILVTLVLAVIGLIFVYSASSVMALEQYKTATYFVRRQFYGLLVGILGGLIGYCLPKRWLHQLAPWGYLVSLALTALTLMRSFGLKVHGSSRWLKFGSIGLQPSEFLKLAFILYVAYFLQQKKYQRQSFWHGLGPLLIVFGIMALVLLKQPDFGLTVVLSLTMLILLFMAGFNTEYLLLASALLAPVAGLLVWYKPYRLRRILTFLNPWSDPQGAGFQIIQSLIAIGAGGWWGVGVSFSKQKFFYLPMQHTDFIFAIIAEETGFVGSTILIGLYLLWMYYGMKLAWAMPDDFTTFATLGFVILISLQALVNLGVVSGLFPTKGVGLPFISYGCSGLVANLIMVGVISGFSRATQH